MPNNLLYFPILNPPAEEEIMGCSAGSDAELIKLTGAHLYLVDSEESVAMQRGEFRLVLTRQLHSPLAAVVALVKDVEWPLGEDCPVIKVRRGTYSFCLPGITYGLVLPDSTSSLALRQLEIQLQKYSIFQEHTELGAKEEVVPSDERAAIAYWNNVAPKVGVIGSKLAWYEHSGNTHKSGGDGGRKAAAGGLSPRMEKRVQTARRLSAVSKLFSRALLKGKISKAKHVTNTSVTTAKSVGDSKGEAIASVDAFTKVVEAVELSGKSLAELSSLDLSAFFPSDASELQQQQQQPIATAWTLNKLGLHLLIAAVAASTVIHFSATSAKPVSTSNSIKERPPVPLPGSTKLSGYGFRPVIPQSQQQYQHHPRGSDAASKPL